MKITSYPPLLNFQFSVLAKKEMPTANLSISVNFCIYHTADMQNLFSLLEKNNVQFSNITLTDLLNIDFENQFPHIDKKIYFSIKPCWTDATSPLLFSKKLNFNQIIELFLKEDDFSTIQRQMHFMPFPNNEELQCFFKNNTSLKKD